jgi:hypothetical protein
MACGHSDLPGSSGWQRSKPASKTKRLVSDLLMNTPVARKGYKRFLGGALATAVVTGAAGAAVFGFIESREEQLAEAERERPVKPPIRVSIENGMPTIKVDAATVERSGIETAKLSAAPYVEQVRAYGMVLDLARLTDLSNSYSSAEAQLHTVQARIAASKPAFERAQRLYQNEHSVSLQVLQSAEAAFRADEAAAAAAQSQLRTLRATAYQEWGSALGKSLMERSELVTRLIERQDFLVQVTLPPGVVIREGPLTAAIDRGANLRAPITFVSPATRTDPRIQSLSFLYTVPAESGVLPGMNVLAFLPSGTAVDGHTVPAEAVIWWQDRAWIYRRAGPEAFVRNQIATEQPAPGGGFIVKDLPDDGEIVTRGAQLLLSEEFRAQIQVGEDR